MTICSRPRVGIYTFIGAEFAAHRVLDPVHCARRRATPSAPARFSACAHGARRVGGAHVGAPPHDIPRYRFTR